MCCPEKVQVSQHYTRVWEIAPHFLSTTSPPASLDSHLLVYGRKKTENEKNELSTWQFLTFLFRANLREVRVIVLFIFKEVWHWVLWTFWCDWIFFRLQKNGNCYSYSIYYNVINIIVAFIKKRHKDITILYHKLKRDLLKCLWPNFRLKSKNKSLNYLV